MDFQFLTLLQQVPDTASGAAGGPPTTEETISIWELIKNGGWYIMIPLGVLSIMTVYIFFERFFSIQKAGKIEKDFMNKIKDHIHENKIDAAKELCRTTDSPISRMIEKGIRQISKKQKDISTAIENEAKLEVYNLERNLSTLATIAGAAPMIGFLGTVIGMIFTFHEMNIRGEGVQIQHLSGGIMQAMITTVTGLIIGILAYIAYNALVTKVDKVVHKMEATSIEFLEALDEKNEENK
ncbi:MAG: MotA/TolQ/ExbB proton channel family protein [Flavobacteriales bacterium]